MIEICLAYKTIHQHNIKKMLHAFICNLAISLGFPYNATLYKNILVCRGETFVGVKQYSKKRIAIYCNTADPRILQYIL